jgi:F-type H+-transporting ATPase subunit c
MSSKLIRVLAVLAVLFVVASPALAQVPADADQAKLIAQSQTGTNPRTGPGLGIGLSVVGIGIGLGLIGYAALSGVARQPEQVGTIRGLMILLAALVEGAGIIGIVFSFAIIILG